VTFDHEEQIGTSQPLVSIETKGWHPIDTVNTSDFLAAERDGTSEEGDLFHRNDDDVPDASTSNPTSESSPSRTEGGRIAQYSDSPQPATAAPVSLLTSASLGRTF
jgi:hypothetical protein